MRPRERQQQGNGHRKHICQGNTIDRMLILLSAIITSSANAGHKQHTKVCVIGCVILDIVLGRELKTIAA